MRQYAEGLSAHLSPALAACTPRPTHQTKGKKVTHTLPPLKGSRSFQLVLLKARVPVNRVAYSTVINAFAQEGDAKSAEHWFSGMIQDRIAPNTVTFCSMIKAAANNGDVENARLWLESPPYFRMSSLSTENHVQTDYN